MISLLLAAQVSYAMPPRPEFTPQQVDMQRRIQEACFPSGLRLTMRLDDRQPVVILTTVLEHGAMFDPRGHEGAAELAAKVSLSSRMADGLSAADHLRAAGASWKVHALPDATVLMVSAPVSSLRQLFEVESHLLADPLAGVSAEDIERERLELVSQYSEIRLPLPEELPRLMPADFFPEGVAADDAPTTTRSLAAVTADDLKAVAGTWRPHTTTLYLTGAIDAKGAIELAQEVFPTEQLHVAEDGSRPAEGVCRRPPRPTIEGPHAPTDESLTVVHYPVKEPWLLVGWPLPASFGNKEPANRMVKWFLNRRLRETMISNSSVREERFAAGCELVPGVGASALICKSKVPPGTSPEKLLAKMKEGFTKTLWAITDEYAAIREQLAWALVDTTQDVGDFPSLYSGSALRDALGNHFTSVPLWHADELAAYTRTEPKDVFAFIDTWVGVGSASVRLVVPEGTDPKTVLSGKAPPNVSGVDGLLLTLPKVTPPADSPLPDVAMGLRPDAKLPAPTAPRFDDLRSLELKNGVRIVALRSGDLGAAKVAVFARGGIESDAPVGLDFWAWDQIEWDRKALPAKSYSNSAAAMGGRLWWTEAQDGRLIGIDGTAGNLDAMLWLLRYASSTYLPTISLDNRRERRFTAEDNVARQSRDPRMQARSSRLGHVLGEQHPLTWSWWKTLLHGSQVDDPVLREHTKHTWAPENVTVVLMGGIDTRQAIELGDKMFKDWRPGYKEPLPPPQPIQVRPASTRRAETFVDPTLALAEVALACRPDGAPEAVADVGAQVLRQVLSRELQSRGVRALMPWVDLRTWRNEAVLDLTVQVSPDQADTASAALLDAVQTAAARPGPDDVRVAGAFLASELLVRLADQTAALNALARDGKDIAAATKARQQALTSVTPAQVQSWLATCPGKEGLSLVAPSKQSLSVK